MENTGASADADRASHAPHEAPAGLRHSVTIPCAAVERVAAALFLAEHPDAKWNGGRARSIWFSRAYTALEALKEPTDAMLAGACDKHLPGRPMHDTTRPWPDERYRTEEECPRFVTRRNIWRRMVEVALAWPTRDDVARAMKVTKPVSAGRAKGGHARAAALTPERRSEIARQAANARWSAIAIEAAKPARP